MHTGIWTQGFDGGSEATGEFERRQLDRERGAGSNRRRSAHRRKSGSHLAVALIRTSTARKRSHKSSNVGGRTMKKSCIFR